MSKIKNDGLDQYGAGPFEQQQFRTAGVEGLKQNSFIAVGHNLNLQAKMLVLVNKPRTSLSTSLSSLSLCLWIGTYYLYNDCLLRLRRGRSYTLFDKRDRIETLQIVQNGLSVRDRLLSTSL